MAAVRTLQSKTREMLPLWATIVIGFGFAFYRLAIHYSRSFRSFFEPSEMYADTRVVANVIFFAILLLLLIAFRRWSIAIEARRELQNVIDSIGPDVLLVLDGRGTVQSCNANIRSMFGHAARDVIGQTADVLYSDVQSAVKVEGVSYDDLEQRGFSVGTAMARSRSGLTFPVEMITGRLKGQQGSVILIRDITARKRAEDRMVAAKEEAERANGEKGRLLAELEKNYARLKELEELRDNLAHMIVHDLKSPLTSIMGYLELVQRRSGGGLEGKGREYLGEALRLSGRLAEMVNSVLDVSRLEKHEMPLNLEPCDVLRIIRDAIEDMRPDAAQKAISVATPDGSPVVVCDGHIIRRVVTNLLHNAVKFTPQGGAISISCTPREDDTVRVAVTDTGPGIPPEYHAKIFERFGQVDAREYSTGLGLTFCKLAVEAHGGRIGVESAAGEGSTFWFDLPLAGPRGKEQATPVSG